jgi:hypothetical protein
MLIYRERWLPVWHSRRRWCLHCCIPLPVGGQPDPKVSWWHVG